MEFREPTPGRRSAEENIIRAQGRSMNLSEIASGYKNRVEELLAKPAAPAVRNEVKKFVGAVSSSSGPEQYAQLLKLIANLEPYKKIVFADIPDDKDERAALALALVIHEKELQ